MEQTYKNFTVAFDCRDQETTKNLTFKFDASSGSFMNINKRQKVKNCEFVLIQPKEECRLILPVVYVHFDSGVSAPNDGSIYNINKDVVCSTVINTNTVVLTLTLTNYWEIDVVGETTYIYFTYSSKYEYEFTTIAQQMTGSLRSWDYRIDRTSLWDLQYFDDTQTPEGLTTQQFPTLKILKTPKLHLNNRKISNNALLFLTLEQLDP
jgi:hypothetical protein